MDFAITNLYRNVIEDVTLLYDVFMLCKNSRHYQHNGKTSYKSILSDYLEIVSYTINEETLDEAKLSYHIQQGDNNYTPRSNDHSSDGLYNTEISPGYKQGPSGRAIVVSKHKHSANHRPPLLSEMDEGTARKTMMNLTWQYIRTVILQFIFEEGSQFPFWAAKVSILVNDDVLKLCNPRNLVLGIFSPTGYPGRDLSLPGLWMSALRLRWESGLYEGILPYLGAVFLLNCDAILMWTQKFTLTTVAPFIYGTRGIRHNDSMETGESYLLKSRPNSMNGSSAGNREKDTKQFKHNDSLGHLATLKHANNTFPAIASPARHSLETDYEFQITSHTVHMPLENDKQKTNHKKHVHIAVEDKQDIAVEDWTASYAADENLPPDESISDPSQNGEMVPSVVRPSDETVIPSRRRRDHSTATDAMQSTSVTKQTQPTLYCTDDDDLTAFACVDGGVVDLSAMPPLEVPPVADGYRKESFPRVDSASSTGSASTSEGRVKERKGLTSANSGEFTWNPISRTYSQDGMVLMGDITELYDNRRNHYNSSKPTNTLLHPNEMISEFNQDKDVSPKGSNSLKERSNSLIPSPRSEENSKSKDWWNPLHWMSTHIPQRYTLMQMAGRLLRSGLAHPCFMIALLMVKDQTLRCITTMERHSAASNGSGTEPDSAASEAMSGMLSKELNPITLLKDINVSGNNYWFHVFLDLAKQKGFIFCLTRGMRSLLAANLIPVSFACVGGGMLETLLYRRMLRPSADDALADIRDLSRDVHLSTHHRITSSSLTAGTRGLFMEAQTMISKHGAWSLLSYFYMTTFQIIPGFFNFLSSRICLFLICGPSQIRERQLRRRKELLGLFLRNKRERETMSMGAR